MCIYVVSWSLLVHRIFYLLICITFLLTTAGCQFMLPKAPVMTQSPCHGPLAPPPPYPCAPIEKPKDNEPASLCTLVDIALRNNPQTRKAWADARAAAGQLGQANAAWFPQIAITWTATRTLPPNLPTQVSSGAYTTYSPQLTASYLIWDFGGRNAQIDNARESLIAAGWNYSWTMQTVMFNVIQSYYNYLSAKALLEGYELSLKDAKGTLAAAEAQNKAGVNTIVDVLQAKAQMYQVLMQVVQQRGQLATARATLAASIGVSPDLCFEIARPVERPLHQICYDMKLLLDEARCCRADLEGIRAGIRASRASVDQQFSALWPTLQGQFTGGRTYFHDGGHDNHDFSESVTLTIPIFSGFSTINAIRQAEAQVDSAIANFKNQELQALVTTITNYVAVNTAIQTFDYSVENLRYAQEAYDAVLLGYRAGTKSITDVLQAENTLSSARANYGQADFNRYTAIANLAYARGALISNDPCDKSNMCLQDIVPNGLPQNHITKIAIRKRDKNRLKDIAQGIALCNLFSQTNFNNDKEERCSG